MVSTASKLQFTLLWLLAAMVAAVAIGALCVPVQEYFAPLWLFPCLQGLALGAALTAALRTFHMGNRRVAVIGAVAAVAVMFYAQFFLSYRVYADQIERKTPREAALLDASPLRKPSSLMEYLSLQTRRGRPLVGGFVVHDGWVWATWALDAALAAIAAVAVVWIAFGRPFCDRCGRWYRAVGEGRLSPAGAAEVRRLAGSQNEQSATAVEYQLWTCPTADHESVLDLSSISHDRPGKSHANQAERMRFESQTLTQVREILRKNSIPRS